MRELAKFLYDSLQEVIQDLVFEAGEIDFRSLSAKFERLSGHEPRTFLKKCHELDTSLNRGWFHFLSSIPTITTNDNFQKIRCFQEGEEEDQGNVSEAYKAWKIASNRFVNRQETMTGYRHRLIVNACYLILFTTDPNVSDKNMNTPLHLISALPGCTDYHGVKNEYLLNLLQLFGADPRIKNGSGFNALHLVAGRILLSATTSRASDTSPKRIGPSLWSSSCRLRQAKALINVCKSQFVFGQQEINDALQQWKYCSSLDGSPNDSDSDSLCALLVSLSVEVTPELNSPVKVEIKSQRYKVKVKNLCDSTNPPRRVGHYRYDPNIIIGEGAMSRVFLAVDEKGRREAALKRIPKDYKNRALDREIRALCEATHCEQVINYWERIEEGDYYFIGVELMEGDLADLIKNTSSKQLLTNVTVSKLTGDMVKGLAFLHQKKPAPILHRDLKPGNVLYRTNPQLCLKLADFGLAKDLTGYTSLASTSKHSLVGTRGWMAPELVSRQQKDHTTSSDVFALGLVCYFLMALGMHPYDSKGVNLAQDGSRTLIPHEVEGNIVNGRQNILSSLSPEQKHFLQAMLQNTSRERPPAEAILHHCYLWSNHKKIQFLKAVGDQKEVAQAGKHSGSSFTHHLSQTDLGRRLIKSSWDLRISKLYNEMTSTWKHKTYDTSSVVDLVRFFRNAYSHEEERSTSSKADLMANIFFQEFQDLCLAVRETALQENWHLENSTRDRQTIIRALKLK